MTCLERILASKSVQALLDLCIGPELDARGKDRTEQKPYVGRVGKAHGRTVLQKEGINSASLRRA
jgi:hypothetical protein